MTHGCPVFHSCNIGDGVTATDVEDGVRTVHVETFKKTLKIMVHDPQFCTIQDSAQHDSSVGNVKVFVVPVTRL